jgi:hypothetical protein
VAAQGKTATVSGRVLDAANGSPIPFVSGIYDFEEHIDRAQASFIAQLSGLRETSTRRGEETPDQDLSQSCGVSGARGRH